MTASPDPRNSHRHEEDAMTEHPVRCPARLSFAVLPGSDHTHECVHPGKWPEGVEGIAVHRCHCGAEWTETPASAGGTETSQEQP